MCKPLSPCKEPVVGGGTTLIQSDLVVAGSRLQRAPPPNQAAVTGSGGGGQGRLEGAVQPGTVFSSVPDDFVLRAEMCSVCRVLLALPGHKMRTAFFSPQVQRPDVVFPFSGGLKMSNDVSKTGPKDLFVLQ